MKKIAIAACLLLAFTLGAHSQPPDYSLPYTPTRAEWIAVKAQAKYGPTISMHGTAVLEVNVQASGALAVVVGYDKDRDSMRQRAQQAANMVAEILRRENPGLTVHCLAEPGELGR